MQKVIHSSFERHAASITSVDLEARMLRLYEPYWLMHHIQDGPVLVQHAVEGSGFLTEGSISPSGWGLLVQSKGEPILVNGKPLTQDSVAVLPPGAEFRFVGRGPTNWTSVFVPTDPGVPPPGIAGQKSLNVIALENRIAQSIARKTEAHLTTMERDSENRLAVDRGFGEAVLVNALDVLAATGCSSPEEDRRSCNRTDALDRAVRFARESANGVLSVRELATAAEVSDRSLLTVFRQHFGLTPQQYLINDRLHRARRSLQSSRPEETTVAVIAARFGFLDFGRFAGRYHRLFGEFPSTTLDA